MCLWQKSELVEHQWHTCDQFETHNLILFNPTRIMQLIRNFLARFLASDCRAIIALDASCLDERVCVQEDQPILHTTTTGSSTTYQLAKSHWYVVHVPYTLRAQYHLLSIMVPLPRVRITTLTLAYHAQLRLDEKAMTPSDYQCMPSLKDHLRLFYAGREMPYAQGLYALAQE